MALFMLSHHHEASECRAAFAAWNGFDSPLRHRSTTGSCPTNSHRLWWTVECEDREAALSLLPRFVAERTDVTAVSEVPIP